MRIRSNLVMNWHWKGSNSSLWQSNERNGSSTHFVTCTTRWQSLRPSFSATHVERFPSRFSPQWTYKLSNFVRSIGSPTKCERRTSPCRACTPTWNKRTVTRLWNSFDRERGLQSLSSHNICFTQYPIDVTSNYCLTNPSPINSRTIYQLSQ